MTHRRLCSVQVSQEMVTNDPETVSRSFMLVGAVPVQIEYDIMHGQFAYVLYCNKLPALGEAVATPKATINLTRHKDGALTAELVML